MRPSPGRIYSGQRGIRLTQTIAPAVDWWGGSPGPRGAPTPPTASNFRSRRAESTWYRRELLHYLGREHQEERLIAVEAHAPHHGFLTLFDVEIGIQTDVLI